jgi:DNA-binding XRE family transcriptional regulator
MYNRLTSISFEENLIIMAKFNDGKIVSYSIRQLYDQFPIFKELENDPLLFNNGIIAPGGCGIIFNDEIDIACEELYENGTLISQEKVEDLNLQIGNLFSLERDKKGITQSELAKITNIHQAEISKIERGIGNPSIKTLERLAEGLGLRLELILK